MRSTLLIVALLIGSPAVAAADVRIDGNRIVIIDGDTVALPCATPGRFCSEHVRIANIDAPEIFHPNCDAELQLGLAAKDVLAEMLRGHTVTLSRWKRKDLYYRTLATLTIGENDVGRQLVDLGLAFSWKAGAHAKASRIAQWCGRK